MQQTLGGAFTDTWRGLSNAENINARTENTRARTAQMPQQLKLRQMQAMASMQLRRQQLNMQRQSQQLRMMQMKMAQQKMNIQLQQTNNKMLMDFGFQPQPITTGDMGGGDLSGFGSADGSGGGVPTQMGGGDRANGSIEDIDPATLVNLIINPVAVDESGGTDNLVATLPKAQQNRIKSQNKSQPVFNVSDTIQMIKNGTAYNMKLSSSDATGKFKMPDTTTKANLAKVIVAMPQLSDSMNLIAQGIQYYGNLPGQGKAYLSAINSYFTGNVTQKDRDIMTKAGISDIAMIAATEQIMNVMNLAKTNETLEKTFQMILPRKGDTPETYKARQEALFTEFKNRASQAEFVETMGIPLDALSNVDMQKYIKAKEHNNIYNSVYEQGLEGAPIPRLHSPVPRMVSFTDDGQQGPIILNPADESLSDQAQISVKSPQNDEQMLSSILEQYPDLTRAQAEAALAAWKGKK